MSIPNAAIVAATEALELLADIPPGEVLARAVLEAAAPHMLAEWEELQKREAFEALRRIDEQIERTTK